MKRMTMKEVVAKYRYVWDTPASLRFSARLAYLDGRTAYAKELNRRATMLAKARASEGR